jgi:hypothetical protein
MSEKVKGRELGKLKRGAWLTPLQYTAAELEVVLGVGKTKIREWTDEGRLPSYPIDGGVFYHVDDVAAFVESYRRGQSFEMAQ